MDSDAAEQLGDDVRGSAFLTALINGRTPQPLSIQHSNLWSLLVIYSRCCFLQCTAEDRCVFHYLILTALFYMDEENNWRKRQVHLMRSFEISSFNYFIHKLGTIRHHQIGLNR
ncbi:unnamed protein product [Pleuronectes platessa]|uniref:Uncharacterized protein n=1 Tax=Pleuronectes platessa TaxID=8262 RepID=A0A9N7VW33_PLEPL|nr:unnamed protein product [Pleuronectes platessa]